MNKAVRRPLVRTGLEMLFAVRNNSLTEPRNIGVTLQILLCQYTVLFILIVCLNIHTAIFLFPRPCNKTKYLNKQRAAGERRKSVQTQQSPREIFATSFKAV